MSLSISETERLKKIIEQEGEIIEFMKHNSAIISIKTQKCVYNALHIMLVEIFSSNKHPVGQLLDLNKEKLIKYFPKNKNFINYLDKCIQFETAILIIIGEDYLGENHYFIWDGCEKLPWEINIASITKEIIHMTHESLESLTNIIANIKYKYLE